MHLKNKFDNFIVRLNGNEFIKLWTEECFDNPDMESEIMADFPDYEDYLKERDKTRARYAQAPLENRFMYMESFLNKTQEQHVFRKYNYLKYKFKNLMTNANSENVNEKLIKTAEFYLKEITLLKQLLVGSMSRLVVNIVKKKNCKNFAEACSDGCYGLAMAVDYFDYTKTSQKSGERIRFTTYAYWVILDRVIKGKLYIAEEQSNKEEIININEVESTFERKLDNKNFLKEILKFIHPREQSIIKYYFGIDELPLSIREISKVMKISPQRIGHIKETAIKNLRRRASHMV